MNITLTSALAVGAGAAIGAWCRWFFAMLLNHILPGIPLGTLLVNMLGGFLAGAVLALLASGWFSATELRLFITTGFLGGLTTFSTFTTESLQHFHKQDYGWLILHTSSHVIGALLFAVLGYAFVQFIRA